MKKYYIKLTEHERSQIIHSLIDKNNAFMAKSRYTDAVGEVILKLMKAKKKASELTEDEVKDGEKQVQDLTDKYVAEIDKMVTAKDQEIMSI